MFYLQSSHSSVISSIFSPDDIIHIMIIVKRHSHIWLDTPSWFCDRPWFGFAPRYLYKKCFFLISLYSEAVKWSNEIRSFVLKNRKTQTSLVTRIFVLIFIQKCKLKTNNIFLSTVRDISSAKRKGDWSGLICFHMNLRASLCFNH